MAVFIGSAKTSKTGVTESGDTLEIVERRKGGLSAILADGQGSGHAAKRISGMVVGRVVTMIGEGVRDGAAARAAHDFLYSFRDGKVSCELAIISADTHTKSMVVSRNTAVPVLVRHPSGDITVLAERTEPLGIHESMKPSISQYPMSPGTVVATMTDGIIRAGHRTGRKVTIEAFMAILAQTPPEHAQKIAEKILKLGIEADGGHLLDDMCAVVMAIGEKSERPPIRRFQVEFPA